MPQQPLGLGRQFGAVAAVTFGPQQRFVGLLQEFVGAAAAVPGGDAGREGLVIRDEFAQAFDQVMRFARRAGRQDQGELLAAVAREDVGVSPAR